MVGGAAGPTGVDVRIEGFEDFEVIGQGGFGVVYRARQPRLNRLVAIKVLVVAGMDERTRKRFEREQQAMGSLSSHPAIVTLYDSGFTANGLPYLAMELMEQGSAADRLERVGPFEAEEAIDVVARIADAVDEAHRVGVLHRDIKPENILFSSYGEPKLTDFGVAAMLEGTATATASVTATVEHAAPEILAGERPTPAGDVYSLGSTLFALLTGRSPFRRSSDESVLPVLARIATEPVPDLREQGLPDELCDVLEASLEKDPGRRIESARLLAERLRGAATRKTGSGPAVRSVPSGTVIPPVAGSTTRLIGSPANPSPPGAVEPRVPPAASRPPDDGGTRVISPVDRSVPDAAGLRPPRVIGIAGVGKKRIGSTVARAASLGGSGLVVRVGRRLGRGGSKRLASAVIGALGSGNLEQVRVEDIQTKDRGALRRSLVGRGYRIAVEPDKLVVSRWTASRPPPSDSVAAVTPSPVVAEKPPLVAGPPPEAVVTVDCPQCGAANQPDAIGCYQCGADLAATPSRLVPLLGAAAVIVGTLLPFGGDPRLNSNAFSRYPASVILGDQGLAVLLGSIMIALGIAVGITVVRRAPGRWVMALAVAVGIPAAVFVAKVMAEMLYYGATPIAAAQSIGSGPWIILFGVLLLTVGRRDWRAAVAVAGLMAVGGAASIGFRWSLSVLVDGYYSSAEWWASAGFVLVVFAAASLVLALADRMPRTAIGLGGSAAALAIALRLRMLWGSFSVDGWWLWLVGSGPLLLVAVGGLTIAAVLGQRRRRSRAAGSSVDG